MSTSKHDLTRDSYKDVPYQVWKESAKLTQDLLGFLYKLNITSDMAPGITWLKRYVHNIRPWDN
jgi:hypothetical protein